MSPNNTWPFASDFLGSVYGPDCPGAPLYLSSVCRLPLLQVRKPHFYFFLNKASELESVEFKFGSKQPKYPAVDVRWAHSSRRVIATPHTQRHAHPPTQMCVCTLHTHVHTHMHTCRHVHTLYAFPHTYLGMCMCTLHISTPTHRLA